MTSIRRAGSVVGIALFALACDGGGDDDGPTGNQFAIQITTSSSTLSVQQGGAGTLEVTLTRGGGFTGAVALAVSGLPTGMTASVAPPQLVGSALRATITVTVAAAVASGTYTGTVEATAMSMRSALDFQVTVTIAPDYSLVVSQSALTIPAGGTGNATIQVNRTNSNAAISLSLLSPPPGISASFNPSPAPANSSAIAISVASTVAPGNYTITIQGAATGLPARSAVVTITVVPAPPSGNNVTYYLCNVDDVPAFFAYQDGTGAWQPVTGTVAAGTTIYSFNIAQGRGGVLFVYQYSLSDVASWSARARRMDRKTTAASRRSGSTGVRFAQTRMQAAIGDAYETYVLYGSTTELAQDGVESCAQAEATKTVRGTFAGITAGQYGIASLGSATVIFDGATATNPVTFSEVPAGVLDLVGSRIATPGLAPNKLVLMRNLNVPDGGALPQAIDFNGAASIIPATATATVSGAAGGDQLEIYVDVITAHGSNQLWSDLSPSTTAARPWAGLGSADMVSGDLHRLWAFASRSTPTTLDFRVVTKVVGPVANQALTLGAELPAPTTSMVSGGSYPRFRFQGSIPADYNKGVSIDVTSEADGNYMFLLASGAYVAASGTPGAYSITMPDIAGLAGFPLDSRLTAGVNAVTLAAHGFTGAGFYEPRPTLGAESKGVYKGLTIAVP